MLVRKCFISSFSQSWGLSENDYKLEHYCKNASVLQVQYYSSITKFFIYFSYQNRFPYLKGFFTSTAYVVLNIVNSTLFVTFLLIKKFLHVSRCWGVRALVLWVTESLKSPHYHSECCHTLLPSIRIIRQQSASGISGLHTWHFGAIFFEKLWVPCPWEVQRHHCGSISANEYHQKSKCSANNSRLQWMSSSCAFPSLSPLVLPEDYQCTHGTTPCRIRLPSKRYGSPGLGKEHPSQPPSQASPSEA